jgi:enamine deaminase RidA (YjgF/YER057c/UK114 family)
VPWEDDYGYPQAVKIGDTICVSGQLSHDDEGNVIAPAMLDAGGKPTDFSTMEEQMRAAYENATKILARFGATLDDIVEETLFVLDVDSAFAAIAPMRTRSGEISPSMQGRYPTPRPAAMPAAAPATESVRSAILSCSTRASTNLDAFRSDSFPP